MNANKSLGAAGEESAALYLQENGFVILGRNVYMGHCEIDIIARDDRHIVFAEVKTRRAYPGAPSRFGRPSDAVNTHKRECLLRAAQLFLRKHAGEYDGLIPNIDVIEVYIDPRADRYRVLQIRHFPNAVNKLRGFQ